MVAGQTAALALKKTKRGSVRKGMVLVDARLAPVASWEFEADIAILTHSTTIQPKYQASSLAGCCTCMAQHAPPWPGQLLLMKDGSWAAQGWADARGR